MQSAASHVNEIVVFRICPDWYHVSKTFEYPENKPLLCFWKFQAAETEEIREKRKQGRVSVWGLCTENVWGE